MNGSYFSKHCFGWEITLVNKLFTMLDRSVEIAEAAVLINLDASPSQPAFFVTFSKYSFYLFRTYMLKFKLALVFWMLINELHTWMMTMFVYALLNKIFFIHFRVVLSTGLPMLSATFTNLLFITFETISGSDIISSFSRSCICMT